MCTFRNTNFIESIKHINFSLSFFLVGSYYSKGSSALHIFLEQYSRSRRLFNHSLGRETYTDEIHKYPARQTCGGFYLFIFFFCKREKYKSRATDGMEKSETQQIKGRKAVTYLRNVGIYAYDDS